MQRTNYLTRDNQVRRYYGIRHLVSVQVSPKRFALGTVSPVSGDVTLLDEHGTEVGLGERKPQTYEANWRVRAVIREWFERDMRALEGEAYQDDTLRTMKAEQEAARADILDAFAAQVMPTPPASQELHG